MLWEIKLSEINFADPKGTAEAIVAAIAELFTKLFAFIAKDQEWNA